MDSSKLSDIAKALNISVATVSRSLNNHPLIKNETKKTVKAMAERMGYQSNKIAAALRTGDSKIIGILVRDLQEEETSCFIKVLEQALRNLGLHAVFAQSEGTAKGERDAVKHLMKLRIDGLIVMPTNSSTNLRLHRDLKKQGVKEIFINEVARVPHVHSLLVDYTCGGAFAVRHLIDQGCEKMAFIGEQKIIEGGFQKECITQEIIHECFAEIDDWKQKKQDFDGIICTNDRIALEASLLLAKEGIQVPKQVALVSFGNTVLCELSPVPISSMDFQYDLLATQVVNQMLLSLNARRKLPATTQYIPPKLIIRKSSQKGKIGWKLKLD
jgi:LacI family transcriptional regulator